MLCIHLSWNIIFVETKNMLKINYINELKDLKNRFPDNLEKPIFELWNNELFLLHVYAIGLCKMFTCTKRICHKIHSTSMIEKYGFIEF